MSGSAKRVCVPSRSPLPRGSVAIALVLAACFALFSPAAARAAEPAGGLAGRWVTKNEIFTLTVTLFPGGQYTSVMEVAGTTVKESGRYEATDGAITLTPADQPAKKYTLRKTNAGMTWTGGDAGDIGWQFTHTGPAPAAEAPAVANVPQARPVDGITGMWTARNDFATVWLLLQSDGTYFFSRAFGAAASDEVGRYETRGGSLVLTPAADPNAAKVEIPGVPAAGKPREYGFTLAADGLTVSGADLGVPLKLAAVRADAPTVSDKSVLGRWKLQNDAFTIVLLLLPDGRFLSTAFLGDGSHELGKYTVKDGELVLETAPGEPGKAGGVERLLVIHTSPNTMYLGGGTIGAAPYKYTRVGAAPAPETDAKCLAARWVHRDAGRSITLVNQPDGSYTAEVIVGGAKVVSEKGKWHSQAGRLRYTPETGEPAERPFVVDGRRLVMIGGGFTTATEFRSRPESNPRAVEPLVGRWICKDALGTVTTYDLLPGGRYRARLEVPGVRPLTEHGEVTAEGDVLIFDAEGGDIVERGFAHAGDSLTLSDPLSGANKTVFAREAGSREKVVAEAAEEAAKQEKINAVWRERIKLAPAGPYGNVAVGEVPLDPKPERVFDNATVFATQQAYQREWRNFASQYTVRHGPQPQSRTTWHFRPNGRFYSHNVQVTITNVVNGRGQVNTRTTGQWGRYRIEVADGVERALLESDAGEPITMDLRDGRRNVRWDRTFYSNVVAALEDLQRK